MMEWFFVCKKGHCVSFHKMYQKLRTILRPFMETAPTIRFTAADYQLRPTICIYELHIALSRSFVWNSSLNGELLASTSFQWRVQQRCLPPFLLHFQLQDESEFFGPRVVFAKFSCQTDKHSIMFWIVAIPGSVEAYLVRIEFHLSRLKFFDFYQHRQSISLPHAKGGPTKC